MFSPPPRRGRFTIGFNSIWHEPEMMLQVLQGIIIIRCEARFDRGHFEYVAVGKPFRELSEGETVPDYDVVFGENDNNPRFFAGFRERTSENVSKNAGVSHRQLVSSLASGDRAGIDVDSMFTAAGTTGGGGDRDRGPGGIGCIPVDSEQDSAGVSGGAGGLGAGGEQG